MDPHIALVDRWYAAWDQGDVDELLRIARPDIEVSPESSLLTSHPGASFHGRDGLHTLALISYENYPSIRVEDVSASEARGLIIASATFIAGGGTPPTMRRHTETLFDLGPGGIRRARIFQRGSPSLQTARAQSMLSPRERQVFQLLARGMTSPQIAAELFLSPATVRTHVQNGVKRLGARTRVQAISIAMKQGEIEI
jgi:DNA-binding NarL/FixJ family response regulator